MANQQPIGGEVHEPVIPHPQNGENDNMRARLLAILENAVAPERTDQFITDAINGWTAFAGPVKTVCLSTGIPNLFQTVQQQTSNRIVLQNRQREVAGALLIKVIDEATENVIEILDKIADSRVQIEAKIAIVITADAELLPRINEQPRDFIMLGVENLQGAVEAAVNLLAILANPIHDLHVEHDGQIVIQGRHDGQERQNGNGHAGLQDPDVMNG